MKHYQQTDHVVPLPPQYSDRQFLHTYQSGAFLPLTQATINAFMGMVLTLVVLYLFDAIDYAKPILVVGAVTWVLSWVYMQRRWFNLTALESRLRIDLNNDGIVGEPPEPKSVRVQVDVLEENGHIRQSKLFDLPLSEPELEKLARGVAAGVPFSERAWTGKGNPFSVNRFREIRSEMLKRGLLAPASSKSDRQGFEWTAAGRALLRNYAPSPTPSGEEA